MDGRTLGKWSCSDAKKLIGNIATYIDDTSVERVLFKWGKGRKVAKAKTAYGFAEVYLRKKHVY